MKKLNFLNKLVMLCLMSYSITTHAQTLKVNQLLSPDQAVSLAQHELPNMLQLIEPEDIKDYGFDLSENFSNVEIGCPFYVVNLPRTISSTSQESLSVNPTTIMLPVILNGKSRCILYVSQEEGIWKVVGIGEGNFVAAHQDVFNTTTNEDGTSQVIVTIPHLSQQYLLIEGKETSFQPLIQFDAADNMDNISMSTLMELNNTTPLEVNEILNGDDTLQNDNQPNNHK